MQAKKAIFMRKYYICTKHVVAELGAGGGGVRVRIERIELYTLTKVHIVYAAIFPFFND